MDDEIKGDAQAIGVGAPPRNPVQKRPATSPTKHSFHPASAELQPQWFEEDVIDTGGVLPAGLAPHGGGDEKVPEPPSTIPAYVKKLHQKQVNGSRENNSQQDATSADKHSNRRARSSRQRGLVGSNAASRANSTLLQKQLATRKQTVKSMPPTGSGGPTLSAASTEVSSFALDLNGTRSGIKRYPYFG